MIERKEYNKKMDEARNAQMKEISDYLKEYIQLNSKIRDMSIFERPSEEVINKIKNMTIPRAGRNPKEVGDEIVNDILNNTMRIQHPRFLALVSSGVSPYSLAGSILTDIYNPNMAGFENAPGPGLIEEKLISWMGSLAGFDPEKCGGIFTSGGSLSNLTAFIAARENKLPGRFDLPKGIAYISDQTHICAHKGLRLMGLRDDQIKVIETDDEFKMRTDLLLASIKEEKQKGNIPFLIVGTLGTTNTGSIDPLEELGDIAKENNMWLHVDGAYGGSILFSDIYRNYAKGVEKADSIAWDTHKWAMQVYSCSCTIVKDKNTLTAAFAEHPEYLADIQSQEHVDGWDLGIELSRPARCIKLWYTLQAMGTDLLADVIDYSFYNANIAMKEFNKLEDWVIISKPMCGALNVRYEPKNVDPSKYNKLNEEISKKLLESGFAFVITTILKNKKVLRLCLINGNTETEDVLNTIEKMDEIAKSISVDNL